MKRKWFWFVLAAALLPLPVSAQTTVFAPFVSRLQGELRGNLIGLSWVDSPDVQGPVYIFRSTSPFERPGLLTGIMSIEVPHGAQFYVDEVEPAENEFIIYYFVVASDGTGRVFDMPLIYTNTISIRIPPADAAALRQDPPPGWEEPAPGAPALPVPTPIPAGISSLQTAIEGNRVIITFAQSPGTSGAVLYRSVDPIRQTADLLGAAIVQMGISSPFTDYPVPGIPYFYAVILEEDLIRGTVEIIPGRNATIAPVEVASADPLERRRMRPMPLPQLAAQGPTAGAGTPHTQPRELSPEAQRALEEIPTRPSPDALPMTPRVFARDLAAHPVGSEDAVLSSIVTGPFSAGEWETARNELARFLSLPRSQEAQIRARFYKGQCYYFMNRPRESLFEFLAIQNRHPTESMAWIQATLNRIREQP